MEIKFNACSKGLYDVSIGVSVEPSETEEVTCASWITKDIEVRNITELNVDMKKILLKMHYWQRAK